MDTYEYANFVQGWTDAQVQQKMDQCDACVEAIAEIRKIIPEEEVDWINDEYYCLWETE